MEIQLSHCPTRELNTVINELQELYGLKIIDQTPRINPLPHPTVRIYQVLGEADTLRQNIRVVFRARLNAIEWQYSEADDGNRHLAYVAPMYFVSGLEIVYHATRTASLPFIREQGILPSNADISATGRPDCYGNIYVCEELGEYPTLSDVEPKKATATWWRWALSRKNRFNDKDWTILAIHLSGLKVRVYRDIWSTSGLILDNIQRIPPDRVEQVGQALRA
jgi:hypothetical protein